MLEEGNNVNKKHVFNSQELTYLIEKSNRLEKKNGLLQIKQEISEYLKLTDNANLEILPLFVKCLFDSFEKCREIAAEIITEIILNVKPLKNFLQNFIPALVQKLANDSNYESSEEIRKILILNLNLIFQKEEPKVLLLYFNDCILILIRCINDSYADNIKASCQCVVSLATVLQQHFHLQCDSLVKPLLQTISHQQYKVRMECIKAIVLYGTNFCLETVTSHLAQRLFDNHYQVRLCVIKAVSLWLLSYKDRYSYFSKILPLFLSGILDESRDISEETERLWEKIGMQYLLENEDNFKEEIDFLNAVRDHYPPNIKRPNLGCRQLVYRNLTILSPLMWDIQDWIAATRIKSAQLLYVLILNAEENITQYLSKILPGMARAILDEEVKVRYYIAKTAELIGYFTDPSAWSSIILSTIKFKPCLSDLQLLASIIETSEKEKLQAFLNEIIDVLMETNVHQNLKNEYLDSLLKVVESIIKISLEDSQHILYKLFKLLNIILSLNKNGVLLKRVLNLLQKLENTYGNETDYLLKEFADKFLEELEKTCNEWSVAYDWLIFENFVSHTAQKLSFCATRIFNIIEKCFQNEDSQLKIKCFSIIGKIIQNSTGNSYIKEYTNVICEKCLLPCLKWKAGNSEAVLRNVALSCLYLILQKEFPMPSVTKIIGILILLLEDDLLNTRLIAMECCCLLIKRFKNDISVELLHQLYPEIIKRLDDISNEIRIKSCHALMSLSYCFPQTYDTILYQGHVNYLYSTLLLHMDDNNILIKQATLEALKHLSWLSPQYLKQEIEKVKTKHRTEKYCTELLQHLNQLCLKN